MPVTGLWHSKSYMVGTTIAIISGMVLQLKLSIEVSENCLVPEFIMNSVFSIV